MSMSTVTEHIKKTKTITHYDYDAFGRRTLVQDEGGKIIRTLYDGLSFDIIREQETFADGYFTNTNDTGIAWSPVSEGDGSRYRYIGDDTPASKEQNGYSVAASNRASSRVALYANGQAVGVNRSSNYASSERSYFGTDLMGTVRSATTDSGSAEYYEYDVFGKPYGETVSDYAYTGKPYDPVTGMYNYGYRDYEPQTARFTTIDPIRDGSNWFAYCNNEPVNFLDAWGLACVSDNAIYYDDYGNPSSDPNVVTGRNVGEPECPTVNIVVTYTDVNKETGKAKGSLTVYHANDKDNELGLVGKPVLTVPIVSGGHEGAMSAPKGTYPNLPQEKTSTSGSETLKDDAHGGSDNIMIRLPNTGGDAIHQGNNGATQETAVTAGCVGITATSTNRDKKGKTDVDRNYEAFKDAINPYGYEGVNVNVIIK